MPRDSPRPLPPPAHHPPAASTRAARAVAMVGGACGPGTGVRRAAGADVMRIGSLFSGVGGLDLGLERAGVGRPAWFAECEPYPAGILAKRWPGVPVLADVRDVAPGTCDPVDVLAGGFPCQDISLAGKGAGLAGERSGLFYELMRVARDFRPRFVVLENVAAIRGRGIDAVLVELDAAGYDAAWSIFGADAVGAPHRRLRWWCVAWRKGEGQPPTMGPTWGLVGTRGAPPAHGCMVGGRIASAAPWGRPTYHGPMWPTVTKWDGKQQLVSPGDLRRKVPGLSIVVMSMAALGRRIADADFEESFDLARQAQAAGVVMSADWCDTFNGLPVGWTSAAAPAGWSGWPAAPGAAPIAGEPPRTVPRGTQHNRRDRIKALGNAVVPQCAEVVGRQLLAIAGES